MIVRIASLAFCLALLHASAAFCPATPPAADVDLAAFAGQWFEVAGTSDVHNHFQKDMACVYSNYTLDSDTTYSYSYTGCPNADPSARRQSHAGAVSQAPDGTLTLKLGPTAAASSIEQHAVVALFGSPQDGYSAAIVYSCDASAANTPPDLWVLSRSPLLPRDLPLSYISAKAASLGLKFEALGVSRTLQGRGCDYTTPPVPL